MEKEIKTIKISKWIHKELKLFCVNTSNGITEIADAAILSTLTEKGHKFIGKNKKAKQ